MTRPSYTALRDHNRRVAGMLADPECVGEVLLVGIGMARCVDLDEPPWGEDGSMPMKVIAEQVYGRRWLPTRLLGAGNLSTTADTNPFRRIRDVFRADRRRYEPADTDRWAFVACGRPMVRRDGLCGRSASRKVRVTDPVSGLRQWLGACSNGACRLWLEGLLVRNSAELAATPPPAPAANTGGVLERHLPEVDWWAVWRAVDSTWSPPPEGRAFERPTLRLLVAEDGDGEPEPVVTGRPVLVVHEGGWR